jgi:hypothetical protein
MNGRDWQLVLRRNKYFQQLGRLPKLTATQDKLTLNELWLE